MSTRDTVTPLVEAARALADAVDRAEVATAFTDEGSGPFAGLCDGMLGHVGPIRTRAERLHEALLDHERAALSATLASAR